MAEQFHPKFGQTVVKPHYFIEARCGKRQNDTGTSGVMHKQTHTVYKTPRGEIQEDTDSCSQTC